LYLSGQYAACSELSHGAIEAGEYSESWRHYKINADLALGDYVAARETLEVALKRYRTSIRLRWVGHQIYRWNGQPQLADEMLEQIDELTDGGSWRYSDPLSRVILGRFYLHRGVDPKVVLDDTFNAVKRRTRSFSEPFVAAGELALAKHDYSLAAEEFQNALRLDSRNPDVQFGLARAFAPSDEKKTQAFLGAALERNPHHVDSLLFVVDRHIDAERYDEARKLLEEVLSVNVRHPLAWSYLAVLSHLNDDAAGEEVCRQVALQWWSDNPEVDHLIGKKLSAKYRFATGAAYQRRALEFDPDYLPAKIELSQDLLRMGHEEEGWRLADEVSQADGYNVVAHNLTILRDHVDGFRSIASDGFVVRMDPQEAEIYGHRALRLLQRAKQQLCEKYAVSIERPTLVEIFPEQQDFAIRTFGLPGGAGFLGVCFGNVITANSPASQSANPANWEAVLWHEYCHVVTLNKTNNMMPRWLSEGISVYEERLANGTWGQSMTPQYREMILDDQLTPVSQLSGAFLNPPSGLHLQFAYYESSLVVEHFVEQYGLDTLRRVLVDLGVGMPINDALQRYTGSLAELDEKFAAYARQQATEFGEQLDWERPEFPPRMTAELMQQWVKDHPDSFWGLQRLAAELIAARRWEAAKEPSERLKELNPAYAGDDSAYALLALIHRELGETEAEVAVLNEQARRRSDATDVYLRLMELAAAAEDWPGLLVAAEQMIAVDPLQKAPHRYLAEAAEAIDDHQRAAEGLQVLAALGPHDPADVHFRLSRHLLELNRLDEARMQILKSLEEAPRFRAAHKTLLEIRAAMVGNEPGTDSPSSSPDSTETDS
jgi:tetratricopeptide (TPR) repeat protein